MKRDYSAVRPSELDMVGAVTFQIDSSEQAPKGLTEAKDSSNEVSRTLLPDRPLKESEVIDLYGSDALEVDVKGRKIKLPFSLEVGGNYMEQPECIAGMDFAIVSDFKMPGEIEKFSRLFVDASLKAGKKITNGKLLSVRGYSSEKNILKIAEAGYFDSYATNNAAMDIDYKTLTGESLVVDGRSYSSLRELESPQGRLRKFEDSGLANTMGVGGIVITADGFLVFPQRRNDVGPTSLGGKFGLSASGVVEWDKPAIETLGIQDYMGGIISKEAKEELGMTSRLNMEGLFQRNMQRYLETEMGLEDEDCEITPIAFCRDLVRGGKPQIFYLIKSRLSHDQMPEKIAGAVDSKKEYTRVVMLPQSQSTAESILEQSNKNFVFNQEVRGIVGILASGSAGREILKLS